ncbi:MAG: hypothetical protein ABIN97_15775 [Ginsengibacter sp.]
MTPTRIFEPLFAPKSINLKYKMVQTIKLKLINKKLHMGLINCKQVYIFYPQVIQLNPEVDRGRLVYRSKIRISYNQIKKGLIKKIIAYRLIFLHGILNRYTSKRRLQCPLKNKNALKVNAMKAYKF